MNRKKYRHIKDKKKKKRQGTFFFLSHSRVQNKEEKVKIKNTSKHIYFLTEKKFFPVKNIVMERIKRRKKPLEEEEELVEVEVGDEMKFNPFPSFFFFPSSSRNWTHVSQKNIYTTKKI